MIQPWPAAHPRVFLGALICGTAIVVSLLLYEHNASATLAVALPVVCLVLCLFPWAPLVALFPAVLFYAFVIEDVQWWTDLGSQTFLLVFSCVALISLLARLPYVAWNDPWSKARTGRMHSTRVHEAARISWGMPHLLGLAWIFGATCIGISLATPIEKGLTLGPHIGIIPEAYFGMRIVFVFAIVAALARGFLAYGRLLGNPRSSSAVVLRRELWWWQGGEERRIARAFRKQNRVKNE